jgi:hypothetical protein
MEDLKQIQEFFSKPLNENVFVEAFKLQKALKGMGYDVKVKAVDDFGKNVFEIYFNNPADADDSIYYDVEKLGYDNVRVFANPQESLDEAYIVTYAKSKGEKPASAAYKHRGSALAFMRDLEKDGYITMLTQKPVDGVDESLDEAKTYKKGDKLKIKLKNGKEFDVVFDSYSSNKGIFYGKIDGDRKPFSLDAVVSESVNEDKKLTYDNFVQMVRDDMMAGSSPDDYISDERVRKDAKYLYNRYLQGASVDDLFEYNSGIYFDPDKAPKRNRKVSKSTLDKIADIIRKATVGDYEPTVTENEADMEIKVGDYQTQYFHMCPGAASLYQDIEGKVEDMGLAIRSAKLQDALFAMEKSALESGATEAEVFAAQSIADQIMAMAAMMGLDKEHSYIQGHVDKIKGTLNENAFIAMMGANSVKDKDKPKEKDEKDYSNEAKVEVDDTTEFKLDLRHLLDKHAIKETIKFIKENNPSATTEEVIAELKEIKELGEVLEEKLCKKGEAYRKRRMAAGEKSSAYLSGRAVKVCKGQISGRSKRKKRRRKKK